MLDNELLRLCILYDIRIKQLSPTEIAKKRKVHRNTIRNIKNAYEWLSDETLVKYYKKPSLAKAVFNKKRKPKITCEELATIETLCKKNLNCFLTPEELCRKLCEKKDLEFDDVKNYDINLIDTNEYSWLNRKKLRETIYLIRNKKSPPKNYNELYELYRFTETYKNNQISYECFYLYARKFWEEVDWENKTLGELIDTK